MTKNDKNIFMKLLLLVLSSCCFPFTSRVLKSLKKLFCFSKKNYENLKQILKKIFNVVYKNFAKKFKENYSILYTRVVPKLVLTLFGQTCTTIYQNSDKAHVFRSSLSFEQAPMGICMSSRSPVTAGFVKTVVIPIKNR